MSPAIRGLKELETLQETQFDGQLDNTVQFRIQISSAEDETAVQLEKYVETQGQKP